ncbi:hypothetical protein, partial [Actinomadura luteofluorescens]
MASPVDAALQAREAVAYSVGRLAGTLLLLSLRLPRDLLADDRHALRRRLRPETGPGGRRAA